MSLFGPPNVEKIRKNGNLRKLLDLLKHKDQELASKARIAIQQLTNDTDFEEKRKLSWELFNYDFILEKIEKLDEENKAAVDQLTQILNQETAGLRKKEMDFQNSKEELKAVFETAFKSLSMANDDFFDRLTKAMRGNKEFLYTMKLPGTHSMSSFSGFIVAKDVAIYFELNIAPKLVAINFEDIKELKFGYLKLNLKIVSPESFIKIPIDDGDKEMIDYINDNISN